MKQRYETEIIREVLQGNPQPFEELVREYQGPIYNLMVRSVDDQDTAADLAQEAFTRAYTRLETFKSGHRFFPWLYSVALNVVRDYLRKNGRDFHVFMGDPTELTRSEDRVDEQGQVEERLDGQKVFGFIMDMAPKYREALVLRYRHDFSMKEIAQVLGISVSGAKMRVNRGLEMIRHHFKEVSDV